MTNAEYRAVDAISSSDLDYLDTNPYLFSLGLKPEKKSKAMDFGTLVHCLVLEPEKFDKEYAVENFEGCNLNKNSKAYKEAKAKWLETVNGKVIISQDEYDKASKIAERARKILEPLGEGEVEKSHFANWNENISVKCRPDFYKDGILIDLKTIGNINLNNDYLLAKAIRERKYHRQLALYKMVLELKGIEVKEAVLLFCNTDDLWVRGVRLGEYDLKRGYNEANNILDRYNSILENGLELSQLFSPIELPNY